MIMMKLHVRQSELNWSLILPDQLKGLKNRESSISKKEMFKETAVVQKKS